MRTGVEIWAAGVGTMAERDPDFHMTEKQPTYSRDIDCGRTKVLYA